MESTNEIIINFINSIEENSKCLECNDDNPKCVSFPYSVILCYKCAITHKNFVKSQIVKEIEVDIFTEDEVLLIKQGGNKRYLMLLDEYSISLLEPSMEYKYLTIASHYYANLIKAEVKKVKGVEGALREYEKIIKSKPNYEIGGEIYKSVRQMEENEQNEDKEIKEEKEEKEDKENDKDNKTITSNISSWFEYFGEKVKNKVEQAKYKINETMSYYEVDKAIENAKNKVIDMTIETGDYITNKGKEISESQAVKNAMSYVGVTKDNAKEIEEEKRKMKFEDPFINNPIENLKNEQF